MTQRSQGAVAFLKARQEDSLLDLLAFKWLRLDEETVEGGFDVKSSIWASCRPQPLLRFADATAGFGCLHHLPKSASDFTTAELKTNFIGTCRESGVRCITHLVAHHTGVGCRGSARSR
jgi:1,4-dihydroxy-2-naphthoyl-CoA hydrolase